MDLVVEAQRLRLDVLAHSVSQVLDQANVPHVFIKGPSTSTWLYDPPRVYRDVDVLVPQVSVQPAVRVLEESGLAFADAGNFGEDAAHSLLMLASFGAELDLHVTLPMLAPDTDPRPERVWANLAPHIVPMILKGVGAVPVLDLPGRCVVLALHAVASGYQSPQPAEDLRRARAVASTDVWHQAEALAARIGVEGLFAAGISVVDSTGDTPRMLECYLKKINAPGAAFGLHRLAKTRGWERVALLWRELFPSEAFMRRAFPEHPPTRRALARAHLCRWRRLARQVPAAVLAFTAFRRNRH